jgi:hypothetical protein
VTEAPPAIVESEPEREDKNALIGTLSVSLVRRLVEELADCWGRRRQAVE